MKTNYGIDVPLKAVCFKIALLVFLGLGVCGLPASANDDFGYWQQLDVKMIDTKYVDLSTYGEWRLRDNAGDLYYWQATEKLRFDFFKNLAFGVNYTYINSKSFNTRLGHDEFKFTHRAELEVTPHFDLGHLAKMEWRNRVELRSIEDQGSDNTRLRSRVTLDFPVKNKGALKSFYVSDEIFYDDSLHEVTSFEAVPFGLSFKINDKTALKTFVMVQSQERGGNWNTSEFLGSLISIKL